jgi:hypothetical protein
MNGDLKINRIKSANRGQLGLLGEVVKTAIVSVPKLQRSTANRVEFRNMEDSMSALGAFCRKNGFDPTRTFQHVANLDNEVWLLILSMFAKYDHETGELMDDGLLYKTDPAVGCVKLNKDFFFALISYLESCNIPCDMRGKIQLH